MSTPEKDAERFEELVRSAGPKVLGYLTRRVEQPADAADLLAEVLIVAWRRLGSVPVDQEEALRWLYGVARRTLANHRRGEARRRALASRLRLELQEVQPRALVFDRVAAALAELSEKDRELVRLIAWEGLTPAQAAEVLGIRPGAARKRWQRAREKLAPALSSKNGSKQRHDSRCLNECS